MNPGPLQCADRLVHRNGSRTEIDRAEFRRLARIAANGRGHELFRGLELLQEPLHVVDIDRPLFAVARVAVARGAAGKEGALGGMRAGISAEGNAVAVGVEIAAEIPTRFEI